MLQSIMEMQKTQGQLVEAVQSLRESQRETNSRVDTLDKKIDALDSKVNALDAKVNALDLKVSVLDSKVGALGDNVDVLSRQVTVLGQKMHTAQTVVWVVGAGLAGTVGFFGWTITNALAVLPAVLNAK